MSIHFYGNGILKIPGVHDISLQVTPSNTGTVTFRVSALSDAAYAQVEELETVQKIRVVGSTGIVKGMSIAIGHVNPEVPFPSTSIQSAIDQYGACNVWIKYTFYFDPKEDPVYD